MNIFRGVQKRVLKRARLPASWCLFFCLVSFVIPSGYLFAHEILVQAEEVSSGEASLGNELLIYTPEEMLSFSIEDYLQHNAPHLAAYAEIISHWCGYSSISPKIIITLIEYQTSLISNGQADPRDLEKPLSSLSDRTGFSMQVEDVATQLADAYYSWRKSQQPLDQNIIRNFLDEKSNVQPGTTQQNFNHLYYHLFPDAIKGDAELRQAPVYGATPPDTLLQLPYPVGEAWRYGGSHTNSGSGSYPQSSLDFNGRSWEWGTNTSDLWVAAAHGGQVVVHSSCHLEVIGSDGWSTTYYHLDNVAVETNETVTRNTPLANYADNSAQALCQGGSSSGPHLHFSLKYDGAYEHLDGVMLSGFSVHTGRDSYDSDCDYFWLEKDDAKYCAWTTLTNPGVTDSCSVPASLNATDIEETTATFNWGSASSAQRYDIRYRSTSADSWLSTSSATNSALISGLTADIEYEFQVRTVCSHETSDYSVSAYFTTYDGVSLKTVGETTVFSTTTDAANRRAVRYTMPEDGTIESISMYHQAGSGNMMLGIYDGEEGPVNLLGKTASVAVSGSDGWQTVALQSPVSISGGETIWLAWVLETNDGILVYEAGDDPRADAGVGWDDGMPDAFGSSSLENYDYSIYASYTPGTIQACSVPSGLDATDIEETAATLNWGSTSSAQSYDIRYKVTSVDSWLSTSSATNSVMISGLSAASDYEFQVRAVCSGGTSGYSSSAYFTTLVTPPDQYTLTTATQGNGTIALDPPGGTYDEGTSVTLTATPGADHQFDHWEGDVSGASNPLSVNVDSDLDLTAVFVERVTPPDQYTLTTATQGNGTIALDPPGGTYDEGTSVTLTATPGADYQFDHWEGDASGASNPLSVTVDSDIDLTAVFVERVTPPDQYTLTTATQGNGTIALDPPGGAYDEGASVTLTATPGADHQFDHWEGDVSGASNPLAVAMNGDMSVTAVFTSKDADTASGSGGGGGCFISTSSCNLDYFRTSP